MDLATILGIVSGLALIAYTIFSGGDMKIFIHVPSMMVVMGGATAATLVNFAMKEVIGVMGIVRKAFRAVGSREMEIIRQLVEFAEITRRDGILAMDRELAHIEDSFMRNGLEMAVDGIEPEMIRNVLETELFYLKSRHKKGQQIFLALGTYAPAFGMIGTLIGLISMLRNLSDPSNIGAGMAVALITTFYGSLLANLVFIPIAGKLKNRSEQEVCLKELIIEGVLAIQLGEHPRTISRKLSNFIPPRHRITDGS